jgi:hypothetical protein
MLERTSDQIDALSAGYAKRRIFIDVDSRTEEGDPDPISLWDGNGTVSYQSKTYYGAGNVIQIGTLSARSDMTVPSLTLSLSGIATEAALMVRGKVIEQAPILIRIAIYNTTSKLVLEPLFPFFRGFVDNCQIETPEMGNVSTITLTCESTSRGLTAGRTTTRSAASSHIRDPDDTFYDDTGVQRLKPLYFGSKGP